MPTITKTVVVPALGVGRPDYSGEQWQSSNVQKLELHENEAIKGVGIMGSVVPSPFVYAVPPIAVGVETPVFDLDTGIVMPYTKPPGYELELIQFRSSWTQNVRVRGYMFGFLDSEYYLEAMEMYVEQLPLEWTSEWIDPTFTIPIPMIFTIENLGLAPMSGLSQVLAILRAHHTEIPKTKTIRCKHCGETAEVKHDTVKWNCTKCGKLNLYFSLPRNIRARQGGK